MTTLNLESIHLFCKECFPLRNCYMIVEIYSDVYSVINALGLFS